MFLRSKGQKLNIGQRSTTLVRFLKSSIFIWLTWNLKMIYIPGHWFQPANYFGGQQWPKGQHRPNFLNCQFSSDWLEIWRGFIFQVTEFNQPIIFEVNIGQKVNISQISKVVNFHPIDSWNLKSIYRFGHWVQAPIILKSNWTLQSTVLCMTSFLFVCLS